MECDVTDAAQLRPVAARWAGQSRRSIVVTVITLMQKCSWEPSFVLFVRS